MTNEHRWLNLARVARIDATSEAEEYPFRHALETAPGTEWRASHPGPQTIQIRFHTPQHLRRIRIVVVDAEQPRTQEFTLSWWSRRGERHQTVVRQQYNFSPRGATTQVENYEVDLPEAAVLELRLVPDLSGGCAVARLSEFLVA
jgi:hypothetical protein